MGGREEEDSPFFSSGDGPVGGGRVTEDVDGDLPLLVRGSPEVDGGRPSPEPAGSCCISPE